VIFRLEINAAISADRRGVRCDPNLRSFQKWQIDKNRVRSGASRLVLDPMLHQGQPFGGLMDIVSIRNVAEGIKDLLKAFSPGRRNGLRSYRPKAIILNLGAQTRYPMAAQRVPQAVRHDKATNGLRGRLAARPVGRALCTVQMSTRRHAEVLTNNYCFEICQNRASGRLSGARVFGLGRGGTSPLARFFDALRD
jgi:hypothetical protein